MHSLRSWGLVWLGLLSSFWTWAALSPEQRQQLPPPAARTVDFVKDIQPILQVSCAQCHGRGKDKGSFKIDTREDFLRGGDSGPAARAGDSAGSLVIEMVSGLDPDNIMPKKGKRLTAQQVGLLRAWIDQGLPWPAEITFARQPVHNLHPRRVEPPPPTALSGPHPVDRWLAGYYQQHGVPARSPAPEAAWARRVYLDVLGVLPTPQELEAFLADRRPDKRERLVRQLLQDNHRYAEHWLSFWNDLLRNDYKGTGYIDGGRKQITAWLYSALATNKPYDQMVRELLHPQPEAEGFLKGIVWRGAVNSSQTPAMQAAQNVSQVFMGVNLKCASCHDSFINDYTLAGTYALANVFSEEPLEIFECDKPTGRKAGYAFIYPELGALTPSTNRQERLQQIAALMTSDRNGRLSRTLVNRLWARFFGRGLVEPVDEMDGPAWHPELLDWLAEDFVAHGYDLKHLMATMLTSRAYQRAAVPGTEAASTAYVFRGPLVRRLTAEQFRDVLADISGVGYPSPAATVDWLLTEPPTLQTQRLEQIRVLQVTHSTETATNRWVTWFARDWVLASRPAEALAVLAANLEWKLYINGQAVGDTRSPETPAVLDLTPHLRAGLNVLAVRVGRKPEKPPFPTTRSLAASVRVKSEGLVWELDTAQHWRFYAAGTNDWNALPAAADWEAIAPESVKREADWLNERQFAAAMHSRERWGRYRAAWVAADPLAVALDRPNREQVCTVRPSQATTLQALELANGKTLAALLRQAAARLHERYPHPPEALVQSVYRHALGRAPTSREQALIRAYLKAHPGKEGIEDFLWSLAMLPEFQMIY
jgi:mono/diheme cytochrome c family protein